MKKKQVKQPKQTIQKPVEETNFLTKFRFICQRQVQFGQAIYLIGNTKQLGQWKPQNSLKMTCYQIKFWILDLQIPLQTELKYKFFISKDQIISQGQKPIIQPIFWIGNELNQNIKLFIMKHQAKLIQNEKKNKDLKTMSFNIRSQKQSDKNQYSWETRKHNCLKVIKQHFPSIIGIQQSTINQRSFLQQNLYSYYDYTGISDKKNVEQQIGIFFDKQRFLLIQSGFRQISQIKSQNSLLGSSCPSLLSFAVLEDTYNSERFRKTLQNQSSKQISELPRQLFLVENIYLNYHAAKSQQQGLNLILEQIKAKKEEYKDQIRDIFILGDFNLPQNSNLMNCLQKSDFKLESIRKNLLKRHLKQSCDLGYTFTAFEHDQHDVQNPQKIIDHLYMMTQDYEPTQFEVVRSLYQKSKHGKSQIISDHYPIMGVFKHKRNKGGSQILTR